MSHRFAAAFCFLFASTLLDAQLTTSTILGSVTDPSGASIANAEVIATNTGTNFTRTAASNAQGEFRLEFLPVGGYRLEITAPGFKKFSQTGIVLAVSVDQRVNAALQVGQATDIINVTGEAPQVNTSNAQIGRTVDNQEITQLPIVGRNVYSLLTLTPGVDSSANSIVLGFPEQRTMINGGVDGGAGSVNYFLDGGTNMTGLRNTGNIAPNPDAVEEFRVITNNYDAEYGRFAGGVINIITKSGVNLIHGSLFEFLRNTNLNANTWGAASKPPLHRNQFGGSVGGPIRKDKTFYFGTYSGLRQITTTFVNSAVVPTALERAGNFTQTAKLPVDPLSSQPFPGGTIPASRFDPTALNILNKSIPLANSSGNVFQGQIPSPYDTDEYLAKVDHQLTNNQRVTVSYFETSGRNVVLPTGNMPWSTEQFTWRQHNANASDTWTVTPAMINQTWFSYTRNFGGRLNLPQQSLADFGSKFQVQGTPSLPQITVTGYFTLGQSIAGPVAGSNFYSARDVLSWTRGRHTFKFGGEVALDKDIQQTLLNNYGVFSFSGAKTANTKAGAAYSGNGFADFLLGLPVTMNQDAPVTAEDNFWYAGLFVQDDYRVNSRLTLNLGLRYDLQTAPVDQHDREDTFIVGRVSQVLKGVPAGMLFPGDPGVTRGVVATQKLNFAPRIGIAWDPFGDGKTSVRAGAGLFWGSVSGNEWNSSSNQQPFAVRQQFNNVASLTNPYGNLPGGISPFPFSYNPSNPQFIYPAGVMGISPDFKWPYSYQLNFSLQRQITKDFSMTAAYVSTLSYRLPFAVDINYPYYSAGATTGNVNNRRIIDTGLLSTINLVKSIMNADYHSLQITGERRMGKHFGLKGFYTFSKAIDDAQLQNNTTTGGVEDMRNLALDRGRTDFDRRHNFVSSLIWNTNYFDGQGKLLKNVLNGWQVSAIVTLQSGTPFSVTTGQDTNLDGTNNDRANLISNPKLDPNRSRAAVTGAWFNTASFVNPAAGQDGTAGRNILSGPGVKNVDIGLFRTFRITERIGLQARAEATNALNLVNLSNPTASLSSSLFGQIRNARDMRQVQMGLRLTF
jgi:outer membrane receptor protein involved in Fe transport